MARKSGRSKRQRPRVTLLKIRAVPLVRMPKSRFFYLIQKACDTGIVPDEIQITTLNWDHAQGQRLMPGRTLSGKDRDELRECAAYLFGAVGKHDIRVEKPDR
jgi:hypothetical protein